MTSPQVIVNGMDIVDLLVLCQTPQRRAEAEKQLEVLQSSYPFQLFPGLALILAGEDKPAVARQLAGLVLKNAFSAKEGGRDKQCKERWLALAQSGEPAQIIKRGILSTLTQAKDVTARKTAAQVVSAIAAVELPLGQWSDLVDQVLISCVAADRDAISKQSALICLSYMSEEFTAKGLEIPQGQVNSMLTAVIQGMKDGDLQVKKEATKALYFAIVLARTNFENEPERDVIVSSICDCVRLGVSPSASRGEIEVCTSACECLVQMATEYYYHLGKYMNVIGPLTWELMKQKSHDSLSMCAIEFWSSVCEEENYIAECIAVDGPTSCKPAAHLARQALSFLIPILTEAMTRGGDQSKQEDEEDDPDDDDTWNSAMAAGTCLSLVAQATGDDCVDPVLQFVNASFNSASPNFREAAMLAYGSIMEGPTDHKLAQLIQASLAVVVEALNDGIVSVRDNAAWAIGRICQFHPSAIAPAIPNLIPILLAKLSSDKPRVAANIAWIFDVLGQGPTQVLNIAPFFTQIVGSLLLACTRPDAHIRNLRMTGYAAVSSLTSNAGKESVDSLLALINELASRLEASMSNFSPLLQGAVVAQESIASLPRADRDCELQGHICGCLQIATNRLKQLADLTPHAERLMTLYMHVFTLYQRLQNSPSAVHEEALLATSSLASSIGVKFQHFMPAFFPILATALTHHEAFDVCSMAIGVVGDLSRALDTQISPFCDKLVREYLAPLLEKNEVDRKLKPLVMTALGDLALASKGQFEPYVAGTVKLLSQASFTRLEDGPVDSEEWIDYLNQLRASVLDAYTGLIHGLREANRHMVLKDSVQGILEFIVRLIEDKYVSEDVLSSAMGLVGDLVMSYQADLARLLKGAPFMQRLIAFSTNSQEASVRQTGQWLQRTIEKFNH